MLLTEPVGGLSDLHIGGAGGDIFLMVYIIDSAEKDMVMDMVLVNMSPDDNGVFISKEFVDKFKPNLMGGLGSCFARFK